MELQQRVEQALKEAIRERDETKRNAIRLLLTAMKNKEKELRRPPGDAEIQQLIYSQVKQRREAAEQYVRGGRQDLAAREEQEINILQQFLPEPMTVESLERLIEETIGEVGAKSVQDLGKVMKVLMPKVAGQVEGKQVNELVRRKLQA